MQKGRRSERVERQKEQKRLRRGSAEGLRCRGTEKAEKQGCEG